MSTETDTSTAVAPFTNNNATAVNLFGSTGGEAYCSLPTADKRYAQALYKFDEEADGQLAEFVNLTVKVEHLYAKTINLIDPETGEERPALRVCVMEPDGTVYSCVSDGVRDSIARLMSSHGMPPWLGGIPVRVKMRKLKNGHQRMVLIDMTGVEGTAETK